METIKGKKAKGRIKEKIRLLDGEGRPERTQNAPVSQERKSNVEGIITFVSPVERKGTEQPNALARPGTKEPRYDLLHGIQEE